MNNGQSAFNQSVTVSKPEQTVSGKPNVRPYYQDNPGQLLQSSVTVHCTQMSTVGDRAFPIPVPGMLCRSMSRPLHL